MKSDVIKFEKILNESTQLFQELATILDKLEDNHANFSALLRYYGSEAYLKDVDLSDNTNMYDDMPCGVLSQDAVYNLIADARFEAIRMLEISTKILKNDD